MSSPAKSKRTKSKYVALVAGAAGGFVSRAIVQPLDVIKIRFQLQVEPIQNTGGKYYGIIQAAKTIYREEGILAFFKGHLSSQYQAVSFSLVQFSSYELINDYFWTKIIEDRNEVVHLRLLESVEPFFIGSIAGSIATIFTQPFDVMRTRFAAQGEPKIYTSLTYAFKSVVKNEGFPGLFRGLLPSLLLIAPQTGFQFFFYHLSNRIINTLLIENQLDEPRKLGFIQAVFSGGVAGSMAKMCVYPFDIIKKRMQVQGFEEARSKFGKLHISTGFLRCIKVILLAEGFSGFFKGMKTSVLKSFVSLGLRFSVYEEVCQYMMNLSNKLS